MAQSKLWVFVNIFSNFLTAFTDCRHVFKDFFLGGGLWMQIHWWLNFWIVYENLQSFLVDIDKQQATDYQLYIDCFHWAENQFDGDFEVEILLKNGKLLVVIYLSCHQDSKESSTSDVCSKPGQYAGCHIQYCILRLFAGGLVVHAAINHAAIN